MKKKLISDNWKVRFKAKKKPSDQPGLASSDKVKLVEVGISEFADENLTTTCIDFSVEKESKSRMEIALKTATQTSQDEVLKVDGVEKTLAVDLIEEYADDVESSTLTLQTQKGDETLHTVQLKQEKKRRFKPGSELTDRVNKVAIDIIEELVGDEEHSEIIVVVSNASETTELDSDI